LLYQPKSFFFLFLFTIATGTSRKSNSIDHLFVRAADRSQYASSYADAAVKGLQGGLDQEGGGNVVISTLPALVQNKTISAKLVQTAFQRLFRIRIRLGMLDPPTRVQCKSLPPHRPPEASLTLPRSPAIARTFELN